MRLATTKRFFLFLIVITILTSSFVVVAQQSLSFSYTLSGSYTVSIAALPYVSGVYSFNGSYFVNVAVLPYVSGVYSFTGSYFVLRVPAADRYVYFIYDQISAYGSAEYVPSAGIASNTVYLAAYGYAQFYAAPKESAVPCISGALVSCLYGGGRSCRIVDCNGTVIDEPYDPWLVDLDYRLPIVYMLFSNMDKIVVVIDNPMLASWIWGNGTVAVAINDELLKTDLFDVYIIDFRYVEIAIYTIPSSSYGFIYLYYGKGSPSLYTEPVFMKAEVDEETVFVQECRVLQIGAVEAPLPPLPPVIPETETPTTTTPPMRVVEIPWWLLLLLLLILLALTRRRRGEEQV